MLQTQNISADTLKTMLFSDDVVLIDVREPGEYQEQKIPASLNIALSGFNPASLRGLAGKKLVFQCHSGSRSSQAIQKLQHSGYDGSVFNLEGGIQAWKNKNFETIGNAEKMPLLLMQQVQITIGVIVLIGAALAYFIDPLFVVIPAIMGAGLVNAGMTGWCGMAKVIAKMPWNH